MNASLHRRPSRNDERFKESCGRLVRKDSEEMVVTAGAAAPIPIGTGKLS